MLQVGVLEARNNLSKLIRDVELGVEQAVVIKRNDTPVAKIVPVDGSEADARIGVARGAIRYTDEWDSLALNAEVANLFEEAL